MSLHSMLSTRVKKVMGSCRIATERSREEEEGYMIYLFYAAITHSIHYTRLSQLKPSIKIEHKLRRGIQDDVGIL